MRQAVTTRRNLRVLALRGSALLLPFLAVAPGRAGVGDGLVDPAFFGNGRFHYDASLSPGDFNVRASGVLPDESQFWWAADLNQAPNHYFAFGSGNFVNGLGPTCILAPPDGTTVRLRAATLDASGALILAGDEYLGASKTIVLARISDPAAGCAGQDLAFDETGGDGDGWAEYSFTGNGTVAAVAADYWIGFEGRAGITVVGSWDTGGGDGSDILVMRLNAAGHLDTTFAADGTLTIDWTGQDDFGRAVAVQDNLASPPHFWVGGTVHWGAPRTDADYFVARISKTGTIESNVAFGFGAGGTDDDTLRALALDPSRRKVYAAGYRVDAADTQVAVARLSEAGALDPTFSGDGLATFSYTDAGAVSIGYAAAVQTDGKLVVAGSSELPAGSDQEFAALRLTTGGTFDGTFGTGGANVVPFDLGGTLDDLATALSLTDGKLLLGGTVTLSDASVKPALVRLWNRLIFSDGFESAWFYWSQW